VRSKLRVNVTVQRVTRQRGLPTVTDFTSWITAALSGRRRDKTEIGIRLVDEAEAADFNRIYRHRNFATNILSFPATLPAGIELPLLGDLVICAPVVVREADEQGKSAQAHWAHLTVHGSLHLLGYDHKTGSQAQDMEALETAILAKLGYPDPYVI
jgi:probable rRNA maturation factor